MTDEGFPVEPYEVIEFRITHTHFEGDEEYEPGTVVISFRASPHGVEDWFESAFELSSPFALKLAEEILRQARLAYDPDICDEESGDA